MELGQGKDPEVIKLALQAEGLTGPVHNRPFRWIGNHLWRTLNGYYQLVIPTGGGLRELALQEAHGSAAAAPGGTYTTLARLERRVWWPGMTVDVASYVRECAICQTRDDQGEPTEALRGYASGPLAHKPF